MTEEAEYNNLLPRRKASDASSSNTNPFPYSSDSRSTSRTGRPSISADGSTDRWPSTSRSEPYSMAPSKSATDKCKNSSGDGSHDRELGKSREEEDGRKETRPAEEKGERERERAEFPGSRPANSNLAVCAGDNRQHRYSTITEANSPRQSIGSTECGWLATQLPQIQPVSPLIKEG